MTVTPPVNKESLIAGLQELVKAIENSDDIDYFLLDSTHETKDIPTQFNFMELPSGWVCLNFEIRFLIGEPKCKITGSEITFNMEVPESKIVEVAKDIWDHPSKYSDHKDGTEAAYYSFTKFLWVEFPDGHTERLGDIAEKGNPAYCKKNAGN